jgi:polyhydroxybutyrate depolymerase
VLNKLFASTLGTFIGLALGALCPPVAAAAAPPGAAAPLSVPISSGCAQNKASTGLSKQASMDGKGRARTYFIQVPANYDSSKSYPLVFVFHAAGGNAAQSRAWGLQNVPGAAESAIFVFPEGMNFQNQGIGWDDTRTGYDLPFFDNMVKAAEADFCIDTSRVFVAGFSWGGDFVTALACTRGETIRAAAANSATDEYKDKANYLTYINLPCSSTVHPAVRFEHAEGSDPAYPAPFFASTSKLFQHVNACSAASASAPSRTNGSICLSYDGCKSQFIECSFDPAIGHKLPPNWAKDTWAFFSTFK